MKTFNLVAAGAALVAGLAGGTTTYLVAAQPASESPAPDAVRTTAVTVPAVAPAPRTQKPIVRLAPCKPPAVREGKACVTDVVETVVLPAPAAPAAPPPPHAASGDDGDGDGGGSHHGPSGGGDDDADESPGGGHAGDGAGDQADHESDDHESDDDEADEDDGDDDDDHANENHGEDDDHDEDEHDGDRDPGGAQQPSGPGPGVTDRRRRVRTQQRIVPRRAGIGRRPRVRLPAHPSTVTRAILPARTCGFRLVPCPDIGQRDARVESGRDDDAAAPARP